jgi:hypothetical protein
MTTLIRFMESLNQGRRLMFTLHLVMQELKRRWEKSVKRASLSLGVKAKLPNEIAGLTK